MRDGIVVTGGGVHIGQCNPDIPPFLRNEQYGIRDPSTRPIPSLNVFKFTKLR
jgi:hypothetical protein